LTRRLNTCAGPKKLPTSSAAEPNPSAASHSYDARAATIANGRTAELLVKMLG
jgi:hypothetical protein